MPRAPSTHPAPTAHSCSPSLPRSWAAARARGPHASLASRPALLASSAGSARSAAQRLSRALDGLARPMQPASTCRCAPRSTATTRRLVQLALRSAAPTVACTWTPPACPHSPVSFSPNCTGAYLAHNCTQQPHLKPPLPGARDRARLVAPPISRSSPLSYMLIRSTSDRRREHEVSLIPSSSPSQLASLSCQCATGPPHVSSPPGCPCSMPNHLRRGRVGAHGATARCQRGRHIPTRAVRRPAPPPVRPCPCRSVLARLALSRNQHSPARAPCGLRSIPHNPYAFVRHVSVPSQRVVGVSTTFVYP
jgi:hypothetical protein